MQIKYSYCFSTQNTPSLGWSLVLEYTLPCKLSAASRMQFYKSQRVTNMTSCNKHYTGEKVQQAGKHLALETPSSAGDWAWITPAAAAPWSPRDSTRGCALGQCTSPRNHWGFSSAARCSLHDTAWHTFSGKEAENIPAALYIYIMYKWVNLYKSYCYIKLYSLIIYQAVLGRLFCYCVNELFFFWRGTDFQDN